VNRTPLPWLMIERNCRSDEERSRLSRLPGGGSRLLTLYRRRHAHTELPAKISSRPQLHVPICVDGIAHVGTNAAVQSVNSGPSPVFDGLKYVVSLRTYAEKA
jgi:hypothetical protein